MPRSIAAVLGVLLAALFVTAGAVAQDGTPSAGAAECSVEPYDLATVLEPSDGTPAAAASPAAMPAERPQGEPAAAEVVAAVTETIEQFIGCVNQGYQFRVLYLVTPDYLRQTAGPLTEEEIAQVNELAAGEEPQGPLPEDQQTVIHSIEEVEVLEDGRVVATVIGDDLSEPGGPNPVYFIFEDIDGRYLIDEVIDPQPDEATPDA